MNPAEFEALILHELAERDKRRRARLGDPLAYAEADALCVAAIMQAAGFAAPAEADQAVRKARRGRKLNEAAAFGGDG